MSVHIRFKGGIDPSIHRFYQRETYYGLIEGVPTLSMNARYLQSFKEDAKRMFSLDNIYLLQLEETIIGSANPARSVPGAAADYRAALPKVVCIVELSDRPVKDQDKEWSRLGLVWFQEEFAFPVDAFVRHQIEQLDGAELSVDEYY